MNQERVVVTGLGAVSPLGQTVASFWENALAGVSGISGIEAMDDYPMDKYRSRVAGQVHDFDAGKDAPWAERFPPERLDRYAQFSLSASWQAWHDAALQIEELDAHRVGVLVGAGMGAMVIGERECAKLVKGRKPHRVHPNSIPMLTINSASGSVGIVLGAKGPNLTLSTACSSSAHAVGEAMWNIRSGRADVMVATGADSSLTPVVFAGFCSLRTLSSSFNDTPEQASRPFDRRRDGFVMGEGAGSLILESLSHAQRRGARIYAEVAGYAATAEAHHIVVPREDGEEVAITMRTAMRDAGVEPSEVDYVNAHATSTSLGDVVEARALRQVFGGRVDEVAVSATKSMIGHTLGAAGAFGSMVCCLSLDSGKIHPSLNYEDPEPECALEGISNEVQDRAPSTALLNAFGFGSNNACVVFRRWQG